MIQDIVKAFYCYTSVLFLYTWLMKTPTFRPQIICRLGKNKEKMQLPVFYKVEYLLLWVLGEVLTY